MQPLGLWLNVAQLFYFPILIFMLMNYPEHFVMTYVIITGAHFFPYAWFYNEIAYAIFAGLIVVGTFFISITIQPDSIYWIPLFLSVMLFCLSTLLYVRLSKFKSQRIM